MDVEIKRDGHPEEDAALDDVEENDLEDACRDVRAVRDDADLDLV